MKKYKLAVLFNQPPFGSSTSREGLDALLAASAFCHEEEIAVCFMNDGVFNLLADQQPEQIIQKDHISAFKLIEFFDLPECFICRQSLEERHLQSSNLVLSCIRKINRTQIFDILSCAEKVFLF